MKVRNTFFFVALFATYLSLVRGGSNFYNDVATFCHNNGFFYITGSTFDGFMTKELQKVFGVFKGTKIRLRALPEDQIKSSMEFHVDDFLVVSNGPSNSDIFHLELEAIKLRKVKKSLLLIPNQVDERLLLEELERMQGSAFFYVVYEGAEKTEFKQVISLFNNTKTVVSDLRFNQFGHIIEDYNLQGSKIFSNTLPWAPYFMMEGCDENGKSCKNSGFLADYMDSLGLVLNFTWESHQPIDGNGWGVTPLDGPFNKSGTWGGAMGSVINEEYHMSLSQWIWNSGRYELLDFISTTSSYDCLALTPAPPEVDFGLFIRPFRNDAWGAIGVVISISLLVVLVPYAYLSYYEHTDGYMISSTSVWFFFLLVNAYYGGALTMFFTSEIGIPFNTIHDVMRAYPDHKLMMMDGNQVLFVYKALAGDELYASFWDRVQNLPEETVYNNVDEGLSKLLEGPNVIHVNYGNLVGYFQANPFHIQNIKVFAKGRAEYFSIVLPFNSPLKPILQRGTNAMIERGSVGYLLKKWEGTGIPVNAASEVMVLTSGQVFLVFVIVFLTFSFAGVIFLCEVFHKKFDGMKVKEKAWIFSKGL